MSSSPVSKLHDDILWYIFALNSHPITCPIDRDARYLLEIRRSGGSPPEPSMITTRRTSQVCRQWREVLLGSHGHSIWANTLDLHRLNQKGDKWREEVFRRTGNAPLTVVGHVGKETVFSSPPQNVFVIPFLLELLSVHWERIRVLVIVSAGTEVNAALRIALNRSAPLLEHCVVQFDRPSARRIVPFANHAPSLSSFNICDHAFPLSALSWACTLRHLRLALPEVHVAASEVLQHLEKLPLLETLYLRFGSSYDQQAEIITPNASISLPRLKHLTFQSPRSPRAPDLFPYINIPPQCRISMSCGYQDRQRAHIYSNFVQAHFHEWNITDISYEVLLLQVPEPEEEILPFYSVVMKDSQQERGYSTPQFEYHGFSTEMSIAVSMATVLSSFQLDRVTTFHLNLGVFDTFIDDPSFDIMYNFIRKLELIETLQTDEMALRFLQVAERRRGDFLFPKLRTIVVDVWDVWFETFFDSRKEGRMIERVLFSEKSHVFVGEASVLEKAARLGITVGWKTFGQKDVEFPPDSVALK